MRIDNLNFNKLQPNLTGEKTTVSDAPGASAVTSTARPNVVPMLTSEPALPETPIQALERKGIATTESNRVLAESAFSDFPELEDIVIEEELSSSDQEKIVDQLELPRDAVERLKKAMEKTDLKTALKTILGADGNATTSELLAKYTAKHQILETSNGLHLFSKKVSTGETGQIFEKAVLESEVLPAREAVDWNVTLAGLRTGADSEDSISSMEENSKSPERLGISYKNVQHFYSYKNLSDGIMEKGTTGFFHTDDNVSRDGALLRQEESIFSSAMLRSDSHVVGSPHLEIAPNTMDFQEKNREDILEPINLSESEDVTQGYKAEEAAVWEQAVFSVLQQMLEGIDAQIEGLNIKNYIVERMTERTIRAAQEFRHFQTTVSPVLDRVTPDSVHRAIKDLTKAINKSEFSLFTDMVTEKKLLLSLSELEKAKSALKVRDIEMAHQIVKRVRESIEAIVFRPTSKKIHAYATQMAQNTEHALKDRKVSIREKITEGIRLYAQEPTSRDVLQLARFMGANHEIEQLEQSVGISDLKNVRELLLKFSDENNALFMQSTGQQMMNDSDDRDRDFYMFTLPYEEDGKIEGMKVFLSGKTEENKLDWQNADLYFSLKKSGERVGLKIRVAAGTVHIETSGFSPEFRGIQSELEQIGYRFGSIRRIDRGADDTVFHGLSRNQEIGTVMNENENNRGIDVKI